MFTIGLSQLKNHPKCTEAAPTNGRCRITWLKTETKVKHVNDVRSNEFCVKILIVYLTTYCEKTILQPSS